MSETIIEKDVRGNIIYQKYSDGYEEWFKYDEQDRETYHKSTADEFECWIEYDDENRTTHGKFDDGEEWFEQRDEFGNAIYEKNIDKDGNVEEEWWEYDESGKNLKYYHDNVGNERWYENNHISHEIKSDGREYWYWRDEDGDKWHYKYPDGTEEWVTHTPNLHYSKKVKPIKEYEDNICGKTVQVTKTQCIETWDEFDDHQLIKTRKLKYTEKCYK